MAKTLNRIMLAVVAIVLFGYAPIVGQDKIGSVYSDLAPNKCKALKTDRETGASTQRCPGIAGYKLLVHDDDSRQSITVVTPDGKEHDLDFWEVVTPAFSSIGSKAEWRVSRNQGKLMPIALIVRVNASEDAENPSHITSYLVVTKLTPGKICITHRIPQSARANEAARRAADSAATADCLKQAGQRAKHVPAYSLGREPQALVCKISKPAQRAAATIDKEMRFRPHLRARVNGAASILGLVPQALCCRLLTQAY